MDCLVCLGRGASLASVRFADGDRNDMYLCGDCVDRFEDDPYVTEIVSTAVH